MKITREEIEGDITMYGGMLARWRGQIPPHDTSELERRLETLRLALAGFDAQWREVAKDPPPKVDMKLIEVCDPTLSWFYYATWHDDLNSWVNQDLTKTKIYGTHWRYAVGPKVEGAE